MTVLEVHDKHTKALFHKVLKRNYADDVNYVYPLEIDIEFVFNPEKNAAFENGKAERWIVVDENKEPIGRI
jgi:hypothetical protein